jgi:hypothetical protein
MNDRLNRAVERLLVDKRFLRRFRRNPEATLRQFALSGDEVEAVKAGDASQLIALGLDPAFVQPRLRAPHFHTWILMRAKKLTPALVLAALALPASPALAAPAGRGRRSRVGRVSRYFGRQRVGGAFHRRVARTGRSGRVTSGAATRRDAAAFVARARGAARDFGIQPPPGGETP